MTERLINGFLSRAVDGSEPFVNCSWFTPSHGRLFQLSIGDNKSYTISAKPSSGRLFEWVGEATEVKNTLPFTDVEAIKLQETLCCKVLRCSGMVNGSDRLIEIKWTAAWWHPRGSSKALRICGC